MELSESFSPINFLKMDIELQLLDRFLSTVASIFWYCLTKPGEVDLRISPTSWIKLRPQGGLVPTIRIRSGEDVSMMLIELPMPPGVLPPTSVLLTRRGVLYIYAPPDLESAMCSFAAFVRSVCGVNLITEIIGFVGGGKTGMVR